MSNLIYKNPISPLQIASTYSVGREKPYGTNFSVLGVGGFMEVYNLSDLVFTIPTGQIGNIEISANTIPIHFRKGNGSPFSFDSLTLNSDNISSGRRRLGMLVYVYETNKIYQYTIDNYDSLWSAATGSTGVGGNSVVISDFGTTVKNNTVAGQNFINAWTASTIEGVNGFTNLNATWRELKTGGGGNVTGDYLPLSGGTVTGNTIYQKGLSADTISATTYLNLPKDISVTGGTYSNGTTTFTNNTGGTFNVTGFFKTSDDIYTTGFTFNTSTYDLTIKRNNGLPDLTQSLSILASDLTITGGTYNQNSGVATFTNNTGGTFTVSGFLTGYTDTIITAFTYNNNTFTIKDSRNSTFNSNFNTVTGLTVNGNLSITGTTSTGTISATTYQNLPNNVVGLYLPLSGGSVTGGTLFLSGFTANTISVTSFTGTTDRIVQSDSGGTLSAGIQVISAYLNSGSTQATLLSNTNNWDINGNYTGTTITGTFMGQKYYDGDYFYEAIADNLFIRLIRG